MTEIIYVDGEAAIPLDIYNFMFDEPVLIEVKNGVVYITTLKEEPCHLPR